MKLNSQKGITMMSLVIYIASFLLVSGIIASITIFFYNNTSLMDEELYSATEYNKLNAYLVHESQIDGNRLVNNELDALSVLVAFEFSNGDKYTLDTESHLLYYNSICLCEDVQDIEIEQSYDTGKEVLKVKVAFTNKTYTTSYTMAQ
jgi:hypothetical protein